jgi:putative SOS response-associated peptidase YedK
MCGRYSLVAIDPAQLRARFSLGERVEVRSRYNVCPGDDVLCVTTDREGEPRGDLLRWGLVPHWSLEPTTGVKMINARAETIAEKPAYREAFQHRRCLVVADGFYEWQPRDGAPKLPWHVTRADAAAFAFAGIWSTWRGSETGGVLRTCSIVTTEANSLLAEVHLRMPVMLPDHDAERAWLDASTSPGVLDELMRPLPSSWTNRRAVARAVNDANHDAPDCLDDAHPADLAPTTLF